MRHAPRSALHAARPRAKRSASAKATARLRHSRRSAAGRSTQSASNTTHAKRSAEPAAEHAAVAPLAPLAATLVAASAAAALLVAGAAEAAWWWGSAQAAEGARRPHAVAHARRHVHTSHHTGRPRHARRREVVSAHPE